MSTLGTCPEARLHVAWILGATCPLGWIENRSALLGTSLMASDCRIHVSTWKGVRKTEVSPLLDSGGLGIGFLMFPYSLNSCYSSQKSSLSNAGWLGEYVEDE